MLWIFIFIVIVFSGLFIMNRTSTYGEFAITGFNFISMLSGASLVLIGLKLFTLPQEGNPIGLALILLTAGIGLTTISVLELRKLKNMTHFIHRGLPPNRSQE